MKDSIEDIKESPAHLASVFADILNPDSAKAGPKSKHRKKKSLKRRLEDSAEKKREERESSTSTKKQNAKREWDNLNRAKPDPVLDRDLERSLVRIATKGVVQLFNAIKEHQSQVGEAVGQKGTTTVRMEKNVKSINRKEKFLDLVSKKGSDRKETHDQSGKGSKQKSEMDVKPPVIKEEEDEEVTKKKWDVLRDDFLLNSAKDWDKDD